MKKAGNTVVYAGAKTMLKTDIVFLDREIKMRKQKFGIEIYDLMEELEMNEGLSVSEKEARIRQSFDHARKDIAVISAKKECKKEEMTVLDAEAGAADGVVKTGGKNGNSSAMMMMNHDIPPSSGTMITNAHPSDANNAGGGAQQQPPANNQNTISASG